MNRPPHVSLPPPDFGREPLAQIRVPLLQAGRWGLDLSPAQWASGVGRLSVLPGATTEVECRRRGLRTYNGRLLWPFLS